jgi:hypothetical protein
MSLRDDLLPVVNGLRDLPGDFGLRRYSVTLVRRTYAERVGDGSIPTAASVTLSPAPRVRVVSTREVAESGGTYQDGDLRVDRITPRLADGSGGYAPSDLDYESTTDRDEVVIVLTGDDGVSREGTLVKKNFDRAFGYSLVVRLKRFMTTAP